MHKVRETMQLIEEDGWRFVHTRGSHRQFKHPVKPSRVTVPGKPGDDLPRRHLEQHNEACRARGVGRAMKYTVVIERTPNHFAAYMPGPSRVWGLTRAHVKSVLKEIREAI